MIAETDYALYGQALAFCGNSLMKPITQTSTVGLDPAFWEEFPTFDDKRVEAVLASLIAWTQSNAELESEALAHETAVEFTRLFVGPPKPAAAPWETFYETGAEGIGFGQATFEMQNLLKEQGLQLGGDSNQYADHMGIELLYVSILCEKAPAKLVDFATDHPASWMDAFRAAVAEAAPGGYYERVVSLAEALLNSLLH